MLPGPLLDRQGDFIQKQGVTIKQTDGNLFVRFHCLRPAFKLRCDRKPGAGLGCCALKNVFHFFTCCHICLPSFIPLCHHAVIISLCHCSDTRRNTSFVSSR